jgi:hypothetical protein
MLSGRFDSLGSFRSLVWPYHFRQFQCISPIGKRIARTEYAHLLKLLGLMLRTSKKFDWALAVIALLHRNFAKRAHTDQWLHAAGNWAQGNSFAPPVVAGNITSMLMAHCASRTELIFRAPSSLILTVLFRTVRLPEDGINDCCAIPMTLPRVSNRMPSTEFRCQR